MKILLITDNHDPQGGGAESHFFALKQELKLRGHEVFSLGFGPATAQGADYYVIKETSSAVLRHLWRLIFNPVMYCRLRGAIKKINPDVIHVHNFNKYTPALFYAMKNPAASSRVSSKKQKNFSPQVAGNKTPSGGFKRFKVVLTVHDYRLVCPSLWNVHDDMSPCPTGFNLKCFFKHRCNHAFFFYLTLVVLFYSRRYLIKKIVNYFIVPSPLLKKYLEQQGYGPVEYLPPVTLTQLPELSRDKINKNIILYAGQLAQNKGVTVLMREFALAKKQISTLELLFAGTGPLELSLREQAKKLGIENAVSFLGWAVLPPLYSKAGLVVLPSLIQESFGMVVAEAMRSGIPVIGSNRGALPWLIDDGKTGYIFDPLKKNDLAQKIVAIVTSTDYEGFGLRAKNRLSNILADDSLASYEDIIENKI